MVHDGISYDPIQGQGQGHVIFKVGNSVIIFIYQARSMSQSHESLIFIFQRLLINPKNNKQFELKLLSAKS